MKDYIKRLGFIISISSVILIGCDNKEEIINEEVENTTFIEIQKEKNINEEIGNKENNYVEKTKANNDNEFKELISKENSIKDIQKEIKKIEVVKEEITKENIKKEEVKTTIQTNKETEKSNQNSNIISKKTIDYKYIGDYVEVSFINQLNQDFSYIINDNGEALDNEYILKNIEYLYSVLINEYGMEKGQFEGLKFYIVDGQINNGEIYGYYTNNYNTIYISNRLSKKELWSTLVHEFGHFVSKKIFNITDYVGYFNYYSGGSRIITNEEDKALLRDMMLKSTDWNEFTSETQYERENERAWEDKLEETFADDFSNIIDLDESIHGVEGETFTNYQYKTNNGSYFDYNLGYLREAFKNRIEKIKKEHKGIEISEYIEEIDNEKYIKLSNQYLYDLGFVLHTIENGYTLQSVNREKEDNVKYYFYKEEVEFYKKVVNTQIYNQYRELVVSDKFNIIINEIQEQLDCEGCGVSSYEEIYVPINVLLNNRIEQKDLKISNEDSKYYIYSELH